MNDMCSLMLYAAGTVLIYALKKQSCDNNNVVFCIFACRYLSEKGGSCNQWQPADDETPLSAACAAGHGDVTKYLLQLAECNPNIRLVGSDE